jgi:hypothetical protein
MIAVDFLTGKLLSIPRPRAGGGSGNTSIDTAEITAAADIPKLSLITADGQVADSNNLAHFNKVVGIVMADVLSGAIASAIVEGEVTDPSWAWPGANYLLFLNGTVLSASPPSSGFSQLIGLTRSAQTVFIRLSVPILL